MGVFISYARSDEEAVRRLHGQLEDQRHDAFFDQDMVGGQRWWDVILEEIRRCDIFLVALSPDSLTSRACRAELNYAIDLDKPLLGVMIRDVVLDKAPEALQLSQIHDIRYPSIRDWYDLDYALDELEQQKASNHLPDPLPTPPDAPIADLTHARTAVRSQSLTPETQRELIVELADRVKDPDDRKAVVAVLEMLSDHPNVLADVKATTTELVMRYREQPLDAKSIGVLESLVADFLDDECTPILGSGLTDWLWGSRIDLAEQWARHHHFPFGSTSRGDLPQVAQFVAVRQTERRVRRNLGAFYREQILWRFPKILDGAEDLGLSDLINRVWSKKAPDQPAEPHAVLARMPCSIYITTQSTDLLTEALINEGKKPVVDFCRWNEDTSHQGSPPEGVPFSEPDPDNPLVYHVFGTLDAPESIVITEDDYFDFLAAVSHDPTLIPAIVREKLADSSLLLLGFSPQDWDLRVLLRGLVSQEISGRRSHHKHVAAVINQREVDSPSEAREYIENYFETFREPTIHVFWSSVADFCQALARMWERGE